MDILSDIFAAKRFPSSIGRGSTTSTDVTTVAVSNAIANIAYGGVGSYVIAYISTTALSPGDTVAGSTLQRQDTAGSGAGIALNARSIGTGLLGTFTTGTLVSLNLTGTWRVLTRLVSAGGTAESLLGLFVRIG